jgi:hypothetical protein
MSKKHRKKAEPKHDMTPQDAMEFCDGLDLPDGAYWAMIEDLSGAEPSDFVD